MPTEDTSRRPKVANGRGKKSSCATTWHRRGKPTKLVLADRQRTQSALAIAT